MYSRLYCSLNVHLFVSCPVRFFRSVMFPCVLSTTVFDVMSGCFVFINAYTSILVCVHVSSPFSYLYIFLFFFLDFRDGFVCVCVCRW